MSCFEEKPVGPLKDVRVQQNAAVQQLLRDSAVDEDEEAKQNRRTIFGFRRRKIDTPKVDGQPEPGKKMSAFIHRTKAIQEEKVQHTVWTGCEGKPRLRPKQKKAQTPIERIKNAAFRYVESLQRIKEKRAKQNRASAPSRGTGAKRGASGGSNPEVKRSCQRRAAASIAPCRPRSPAPIASAPSQSSAPA